MPNIYIYASIIIACYIAYLGYIAYVRLELDPMVLPLPKGKSSKVFAGTVIQVTALNVQPHARCQRGAHETINMFYVKQAG